MALSPRWKQIGSWVPLALLLLLTLLARCYNRAEVFHGDGRIYFIEGDCYSRMTRAKLVSEGQWIVKHHAFENAPTGVESHTTAPLDWSIVALKNVCDFALKLADWKGASVLRSQTLDLAGALISPFFALVAVAWLWWWTGYMRLPYRWLSVLFFALSPVLVHGTELGRPDHQSLLIVVLLVAVCSELALADTYMSARSAKRWAIAAGAGWGLALWVSFYEPLVFFAGAVGQHFIFNRTALFARPVRWRWIVLGSVFLVAVLVDGWRLLPPSVEVREHFAAWSATISELRHLDIFGKRVWFWYGALWLTAPVLLFLVRRRESRAVGLLLLVVFMLGLTVWQMRWGYFLALALAVSLPWQAAYFRERWAGITYGLVAMLPLLWAWSAMLHPDDDERELHEWRRGVQEGWRGIAELMVEPGTFLAPWWASPQIAYWSGQPGVAGTSHQSLPGIVDTARFYLADSPQEAAAILKARNVRYVLVDDVSRTSSNLSEYLVVSNSAAILQKKPAVEPFARTLIDSPRQAPPFLHYMTPQERGIVVEAVRKNIDKTELPEWMQFSLPQYHQLYIVQPDKL